jgi:hypothetical protein
MVTPIIHIPLSGGDGKAKTQGIHESAYRESVLIPERCRGENPGSRSAGVRSLERNNVGRRSGNALAQ